MTWVSRDALTRLDGLGHYYGTGGANDVLWLYDFNPASQIRSLNRDSDTYAWTGHYAVNRGYTANGLNQYTAAGGATFGYDLNGNLSATPGPNGQTIIYTYDVENRLVSATPGGTLAYDTLGRLYQITATDGTVTRFLYDGDALVAEYNAAGDMTRRYVHWDGADVPIMSYAGATLTAPNYLHADHQGSIVAISGASGASQINRYDEYGIPAATNAGRFQYTGQAWLAELGLYYYKARIYSPPLGRFLQTDPVGYQDRYNLYAYVGNDPVNSVDPSGTQQILTPGCVTCHSTPTPAAPAWPQLPNWSDIRRALGAAGAATVCTVSPTTCAAIAGERVSQAVLSDGRATGEEVVIDDHIADALEGRGWSEQGVRDLTETEPTGTSTDNRTVDGERRDDPATVYGSAQGGYVVVNDRTGEVVQISDRTDGNWRPDRRIRWQDDNERRRD